MALFGFGKKTKKENKKQQRSIEHIALNKRKEFRYVANRHSCSVGEITDISKKSVGLIVAEGHLKEGENLQIECGPLKKEGTIARIGQKKIALRFGESLERTVVNKLRVHLEDEEVAPKSSIDSVELEEDEDLVRNRALIDLMLELEDPNTNAKKLRESINALPELKNTIVNKANSIESARQGEVSDVASAVTRLGFDTVKKMTQEYITYVTTFCNPAMKSFEEFDIYKVVMSAYFKRLAPFFSFKDAKNEAVNFLNTLNIGAEFFSKKSEKLANCYRSPLELFSFEMRFVEKAEFGIDLLELDKKFFVDELKVFQYIYDGFVLANMMLYPKYEPTFKISLSERKMRFAFVVYLTLLALKFIVSKDKYSGMVLYNRLKRLGFDETDAKEFINDTNALINQQLKLFGINKVIKQPDIASYSFSIENYIGSGIYYDYLYRRFEKLSGEATRLALRVEDNWYSMEVLEKIVNFDDFDFKRMAFVVVPCGSLEDEDLPLDQFKAFNLLIFQNVDKLPKHLIQDFKKLWRDFDGDFICTFSSNSLIEFDNEELYELLLPYTVDFPSYYQSPLLYTKMLTNTAKVINKFAGSEVCDIAEFKSGYVSQKSVYVKCLG